MTVPRPCLTCGVPAAGDYCERHKRPATPKPSPQARGYDAAWRKLSRLARQLQPWCSHCRTTQDLTADHLVWPATTLAHVQVLCRSCNGRKGRAPRGVTLEGSVTVTPAEPQKTNTPPDGGDA